MMKVEITFEVGVTMDDIDDIMWTALERGIGYWCRKADIVGECLGEYTSDQIARGGSLILYDAESDDKWELTLDKFMNGIRQFLTESPNRVKSDKLRGYRIQPQDIDRCDADCIIQYALFGKLLFSEEIIYI